MSPPSLLIWPGCGSRQGCGARGAVRVAAVGGLLWVALTEGMGGRAAP
jgi:hypothetical protein